MIHYTNKHTKWALCGRIPAADDLTLDLTDIAARVQEGTTPNDALMSAMIGQLMEGATIGDGICPTCEGRRKRGQFCFLGHVWDATAVKGTPCQCGELHLFADEQTIRIVTFDELESATDAYGNKKEPVTH